ncbi:filament-like plant protein [Abrus precatorius]|uniref:Filament-like plant protein n=1 Tax=Abrus precatorius TaxID=3816 RepID=A0A8B8JKC3_ABRPR|nr:filament-like plant protein [Abrus precatorius]
MPLNFQANVKLLDPMMDKKRWLWKRKSSEKSPGETESSGSVSSHSERFSDEQEALKDSPNGSNQSPDVTSKAVAYAEDGNHSSLINAQLPEEVTSTPEPTTDIINDGSLDLENDENGKNENIKNVQENDINDGLKNMSEKLSAALVNVNAKEDLVKQHAKVAEEAIAGWEKAENEVAVLKKQLDAVILRNSALEDRVTHLDGALKECVRQLRQTREEQEENIYDAVAKKTQELESAKMKLESKLIELQNKLDASEARSSVDFDLYQKVECLEKENMALRHEILVQSEELEIRTIERDLSTQAAETASKQHLESIKKVAKLEAECRRLKTMASRASVVNDHKSIAPSSFSVESLTDSQSDSGERLNATEIDTQKMNGSEPNKCEPSCSDSWASALIAELDQFKNEKCRQTPSSSVKIDLMDDFLEMERLVALPETKNKSFVQESVVANQCIERESSLRVEFEIMNQQMDELKEKLERVEADKAELEIALMKSEECIEESQLQLRESEEKLEELQRELENAYKSKQRVENHLMSMVAEAQTLSAKVDLLEAEVDKERAVSTEIAIKCNDLEEELERKSAKVNLLEAELDEKSHVSNEIAIKYNDLEEELEIKSTKVELLEAEVAKERAVLDKITKMCKDLEEKLESKSAKVELLEAEVDKERAVSDEISMKCKGMEEKLESKSAKVDLLEEEVHKKTATSEEIAMKCKDLEEKLEIKSAKIDLLEEEVHKERATSEEIAMKCKDLEENLEIKSAKIDLLEEEVHKERATSEEIAMKCRELEEELLRSTACSYGEKKIKQEDLELAAGKLAECQKTIASLGNQLKSLATLEDFLIDTPSIPASPSLIAQAGGEMWKLHSNGTFSPKRDSTSSRLPDANLNKNEETSPPSSSSSTSSTALPNHVSSERSRNGFAKFFSRTKSGIRLEI